MSYKFKNLYLELHTFLEWHSLFITEVLHVLCKHSFFHKQGNKMIFVIIFFPLLFLVVRLLNQTTEISGSHTST